ncbi:hypothetical protein [Pseudonocardia parietis]|uniref:RecT family protein n=1 Tax=Pseudonocardia parietis TaxID=570936 RepID=A0ABS4W298_9PSEU|nr:hypothetical protein [Pseudonocardia parietis]MBP2370285.1 hypothetical protein [Pseudonocardia parietis]
MTAEMVTTETRATMPDKIAYARELAQSGLLPASYRKQPANLLYAVEYGEMLNLSPMAAVTGVHVIEGKPTASAALISALVRRAGHRLRVTGDDRRAVVEIVRSDDPDFTFRAEWTIERAKTAGLVNKSVWKNYPAAMLKARAVTECARDACEEALMGMHHTPEEMGADVDEDGIPTRPSPLAGTAQHTASASAPGEPEPDWSARIVELEEAQDRAGLVQLWKQAKAWHPDDSDLLGRIESAGARVKAAVDTAEDVVDGEVVDDEPPPDDAQRRVARMHALFGEAGLGGDKARDRRLKVMSNLIGRDVTTSKELSAGDRDQIIRDLERYQAGGDLENAESRAQEDAELARYAAEQDAATESGGES